MKQHGFTHICRFGIGILVVAILAASLPPRNARAASRYYVRGNGGDDTNSGLSWNLAFKNLQKALSVANSGDEIWVAKAVYYPDNGGAYPLDSRFATFTLENGVQVYGGFAGTETDFSQRNWTSNVTILSGDVDNNDLNTDGDFIAETTGDIVGANAYHVVTSSGNNNTAVLDGFHITAGQANANGDPDRNGGGLYSYQSSPNLRDLLFVGNYAGSGGGMFNQGGNPSLNGVEFEQNFALYYGGGMWNQGESYLGNVFFDRNLAGLSGGGLMNFGAALDQSNPTLENSTFLENQAPNGGGMANELGNPSLIQVVFHTNTASIQGGGMANYNTSAPSLNAVEFLNNSSPSGGGMYNNNSQPGLTFVDFRSNQASFGAGMYNENSDPTLFGGKFEANVATDVGGGMANYNGSASNLQLLTFKSNQAPTGAGMYNHLSAPQLTNVDFTTNQASSSTGGGGGMYNFSSSPVLNKVNFTGNSAVSAGGGMYNYNGSSPQLTNVNFSGNFASNGGGMRNHFNNNQPALTNVTFSGNEAQYAGGMSNDNSTPLLYSVTFSGNSANQGGGMHNYQSSPQLWNVTFFGNVAEAANQGGGMYNIDSSSPFLRNVILAGSTNGDCVNGAGGSVSGWYSLIQDTGALACGAIHGNQGFIVGQDPKLGPLAHNGGFTWTHLPLSGSPVIDHVQDNTCQPAQDQRGFNRFLDGDENGSQLCDIGSVEYKMFRTYLPLAVK